MTSLEVTGVPSLHVTPGRIFTVRVLAATWRSWDSAIMYSHFFASQYHIAKLG